MASSTALTCVDALLVAGCERGGQPGRDHPRAAADRAVEQVTALGLDQVAEAGLAVHVDGAHLDVDGARLQGGERAVRARDDLLNVVGGGDDRDDDVRGRGDLGRAGGHLAALLDQLGRAAAPVAGDAEAAHHQVPGDGQAHLAQADHANSVHRCLLAPMRRASHGGSSSR